MRDYSQRNMARARWIMDNLRAGRRWATTDLIADFGISASQGKRVLKEFRATWPEWVFAWDSLDRTFFLVSAPDSPLTPEPGKLSMAGGEVREIRNRLLLTQEQLADCCGTTQGVVDAWEQGRHSVPVLVAFALRAWDRARWFGIWEGRQRKIYEK